MPRDWWELLETFQRHRVRYLLIGGHAVSAHGSPRATEDIDLWVDRTLANGKRLHAALVEFGLGSFAPKAEEILDPDTFWQFGRKPLRVDILTNIPAVSFRTAWPRRAVARMDGLEIPVLGLDDLIANKRAAGRAKDFADVEMLVAFRRRRPR